MSEGASTLHWGCFTPKDFTSNLLPCHLNLSVYFLLLVDKQVLGCKCHHRNRCYLKQTRALLTLKVKEFSRDSRQGLRGKLGACWGEERLLPACFYVFSSAYARLSPGAQFECLDHSPMLCVSTHLVSEHFHSCTFYIFSCVPQVLVRSPDTP